MQNIYQQIYQKLDDLFDMRKLEKPGYRLKLKNKPFMNLTVENLHEENDYFFVISLAHFGKQSGDIMSDPEMTIRIWKHGMAEAQSYANSYLATFQEIYTFRGGYERANMVLKEDLNKFLLQWLINLEAQGFGKKENPIKMSPCQ